MKTKHIVAPRKPAWTQNLGVAAVTALVTLMGLPAHAVTTSFPDHPLLTGGNAIPPNLLLILDDSGSMESAVMLANGRNRETTELNDDVSDRSYVTNTLYYDPRNTYLPWRTSSTDLSARLASANFRSAASSYTSPTASTVDLRSATNENGVPESYFYVPRVANPGTTASNYDKYRIGTSSSSTSWNSGAVQKLTASTLLGPATISSITRNNWSTCFVVNTNGADSVTIQTSGGSGDGDLSVYTRRSDCTSTVSTSAGGTNSESITIDSPQATISFRIYAYSEVRNISYTVTSVGWPDMTPSGNTSALQQAELQNFANWYQYHRTRNKMAKAGASEAFGRLGKNYRVGYDTIWNRGGGTANTGGSAPALPIPYATGGGLFEGTNRTTFYSRLQNTGASGSTPLKGALQRSARYFMTDDPWKTDSSGAMMTCRQNYAILTTDGYWNSDSGYNNVGNADASTSRDVDGNPPQYPDRYSDTVADVAYRYWSTDLRADMANNVLTSTSDPADWQHMVTFGVSIGLQGTLNPENPPPSPWNVDPINNSGAQRIDDLWHASLNGRGKFVVASNSDKFAEALTGALAAIDSRSASGSNIASSSTKTDTTTLTFVAGFTSGTWVGDLIASPFNAALTGVSTTPDWVLSQTFATGRANANFQNRTVLTMKSGAASLFNSAMTGAGDLAARTGQADAATADENITYIRGGQSKEVGQVGGTLRRRAYPIGDIVNSSPAYVEDTKTVYIGANDGMLHAINANSADTANRGQVLFSYLPKGIDYTALASLSATAYEHRHFVDGQIDVTSRAMQGSNKNILVGALGRGGRGVFALDVTTPTAMGTSNVLWDQTVSRATANDTTEPNMGFVLGRVLIRNGNGGKTYAFVPNGIDSPNGSATLFVYELNANGGIASTTRLVADNSGGNGLMSLGMADLNGDGKVDTVYGGDLKGNVWRWDFSAATLPTSAVKLFQAMDAANKPQPITGGLAVGRSKAGEIFVGFGTGRFLSSNDMPGVATQTAQTLYGLKDSGSTIAGRANLQARTIPYSGTTASGAAARGFENYSVLQSGKQGWYIDLTAPERVISSPTVYGTAMYVSSVIPPTGSDCNSSAGSGFLNALNLFTGTSPEVGGYFSNNGRIGDGVVGSVGISGGMPTEANVTSSLATVGTGAFSSENGGAGNTESQGIEPPAGGRAARVSWREVMAQ
ncbi:PilC/PilY family type IV pilus protein [Pseudoxanthomonas sp. LjRoot143]|uniref:pilus assembly protein n=1 Tax=Pseudoxanthomonas sp. LjRoot143 TaxID=3342266 RepID=UPI003ED0CDC1